jgi:membrane protease YdiL (CAAX protease family)
VNENSAEIPPTAASSGLGRPLGVAIGATALVTALSYVLPAQHAATGVGLAFLAMSYWLTLHPGHPDDARRFGLSLGGLMEPEPLDLARIAREATRAAGWAVGLALLIFPPFWLGYVVWWQPAEAFEPRWPTDFADEVLGHLLVIALPEEAFYRGYLQQAFDEARPPRWRILGARLGPGVVLASALFSVGHLLTEVHPNRLAVFFPALAFGWLRARTGGIGASVIFHALCNLFASFLARGYGFFA